MDPALIRTAIHQARGQARQIGDLTAANDRVIRTLEAALNLAVKGASNDPSRPADIYAPTGPVSLHRREHRPGNAPKIDGDPELQAFIVDRIDRMTFDQIAAEVATAFPPARRVRKTAIHAWWKRSRKARRRTSADAPG